MIAGRGACLRPLGRPHSARCRHAAPSVRRWERAAPLVFSQPANRRYSVQCKWFCFYGAHITTSVGAGCDRGGSWRCVYQVLSRAPRGPGRLAALFTAADACASLALQVKHRHKLRRFYIRVCGPTSKFGCRSPGTPQREIDVCSRLFIPSHSIILPKHSY